MPGPPVRSVLGLGRLGGLHGDRLQTGQPRPLCPAGRLDAGHGELLCEVQQTFQVESEIVGYFSILSDQINLKLFTRSQI